MVARKILILLVVVFVFYGCNEYGAIYDNKKCKNTEPNISVEEDCLEKNSAILANSLINLLGKDYVSQMLENKIYVGFVFKINSNGCILNTARVDDRQNYLSETTIQQIVNYLIKNNICFEICFEHPVFLNEDSKENFRKSIIKNSHLPTVVLVGFPAFLMMSYDYGSTKFNCTRFEYLKKQIEKYLPKGSNENE